MSRLAIPESMSVGGRARTQLPLHGIDQRDGRRVIGQSKGAWLYYGPIHETQDAEVAPVGGPSQKQRLGKVVTCGRDRLSGFKKLNNTPNFSRYGRGTFLEAIGTRCSGSTMQSHGSHTAPNTRPATYMTIAVLARGGAHTCNAHIHSVHFPRHARRGNMRSIYALSLIHI